MRHGSITPQFHQFGRGSAESSIPSSHHLFPCLDCVSLLLDPSPSFSTLLAL